MKPRRQDKSFRRLITFVCLNGGDHLLDIGAPKGDAESLKPNEPAANPCLEIASLPVLGERPLAFRPPEFARNIDLSDG
jgi:hypothetical protein